MSEKLKALWFRYGGWFLFGLILMVIVIIITIGQSHRTYANTSHTEAPPPAESEVTFDLDINKAYTAEDGVVVIPAAEQAEKSVERPSDPVGGYNCPFHRKLHLAGGRRFAGWLYGYPYHPQAVPVRPYLRNRGRRRNGKHD